jgi:hypothetical protein
MATDGTARAEQSPLEPGALAAFVAELAGKSDLIWIHSGADQPRPVWSVWHDDHIAVVTDGAEQPNPGLADGSTVTVILRSKDNWARQASVRTAVEKLLPGSEAWDETVAVLHPKRLNASDGDQQPKRWARESTVWRLHPSDDFTEEPGSYKDDPLRAEPMPTAATTLARRPFHAGRATKKRR